MLHPLKSKKLLFFILLFSISFQQVQTYAAGLGKSKITQADATKFLLINFIVGNIVAWSMGAYPRSYEQLPYSQEELGNIRELQQEIESYPDEVEPKKDLGLIYFNHNDLERADEVLESALQSDPNHAESLAVWGGNEAKSAGAMWDFTWGIWKLIRLDNAVEGLNRAVELEPNNFNVRLFRINTVEGMEGRRDSLQYAFLDEQWYLQKSAKNSQYLPAAVHMEFLDALIRLHLLRYQSADEEDEAKERSRRSAIDFYRQLRDIPVGSEEKEKRMQNIAERFAEQDIPIEIAD